MVKELKHIRYVYHYTSIETLFSILEHYRKEKNKVSLNFHASNIYKMNDPKEMEAGYNIVKSFLCEFEKKEIPEAYWLYDITNSKENENKCKEDYIVGNKNYMLGTGIVPYTISFSARRDYLPMWSLYGKSGKGVCFKFDAYNMIMDNSNGQFGFVAYDMKSGMKTMKEIIPVMYKFYMNSYEGKLNELSIYKKMSELSTICLSVSPFIKFKDYKYEKEFRLVYYHHYGLPDRISTSSTLDSRQIVSEIAPYLNCPISVKSLKEIIIGPNLDKDSFKNIIKREISACKLDVKVSQSKVPFHI